jgi:PHP family Zn ribbon phosphoesterase
MDPKEFRSRLDELAVIKETKPKSKPKMIKEMHVDEFGEEYTIEVPEWTHNPTIPYKLEKIKPKSQACVLGCGNIVENQVVERRLALTPQKHWRTRCQNCTRYVHPTGNGFIEDSHQIASEYIKYFRDKGDVSNEEYLAWLAKRKLNQ